MSVNYISRPGPKRTRHGDGRRPLDPGDLSKRITQRRAELGLSAAQVAVRARTSLRYLEYLERYPARPTPATLRQLAAALQTTLAALLGAGVEAPPGHPPPGRPAGHQQAEAGRVPPADRARRCRADRVRDTPGPVVVPVNFAVLADTIVIRTAEGSIIDGHADEKVALEVDHIDEALCQGWSVLVRGPAHRVTHPAELRRLQEDVVIWPWPGGEREVYVRIVPSQITGRRIEIR